MSAPLIFDEPKFQGLDLSTPPDEMAPGFLTVCDDAVFVGHLGDGGDLQTRPGFRAQWTEALGNVYIGPGIPFRDNNGVLYYVFVAGSSASDTSGSLYSWTKDNTTRPTAISTGGVAFNVGAVQMARFDDYVFIVGATDGKVYRYNPATGIFEGIAGASTPTYTALASLTNNKIVGISTTADLSFDMQSGSTTVDNFVFSRASTSGISAGSNLDAPGKWKVGDIHGVSSTQVEATTGVATVSGRSGGAFTGTSHTSTTIDGIASTATLDVGMVLTGSGVANDTYITAVGTNSITLNQATGSSTTTTFTATPYFVRLDTAGDAIVSSGFYANLAKTTPFSGTAPEAVTRYVDQWVVQFQFHADTSTNGVACTLYVFSSNSSADPSVNPPVAALYQTVTGVATARTTTLVTMIFSADASILDTQAKYLRLEFKSTSTNAGGSVGPYISQPSISAVLSNNSVLPTASVLAAGGTVVSFPSSGDIPGNNQCSTLRVGQFHASYNVGAEYGNVGRNWSSLTQIAIPYTPYIQGMPTPRVKLRIRNGANLGAAVAATAYDTAEMQVYTDGTGHQYFIADISTISTRNAVYLIDFVFVADVAQAGTTGQNAFLIGPIISAGNLSVGYATYTYAVRERTASTSYLSQSIYASPGLNPTQVQATGQLVYSATIPTNIGATVEVWRAGGTFTDGLYRKVGEVSFFDGATVKATTSGASATIAVIGTVVLSSWVNQALIITGGSNFTAGTYTIQSVDTSANTVTLTTTVSSGIGAGMIGYLLVGVTYDTYTNGTLTFTDSTPDSSLIGTGVMTDHAAPQFGTSSGAWGKAVSVAVFAQRLAIGTQIGSANTTAPGVFLSQVAYGGELGLYWDIANNLAATNVSTQGWYRRITGNENANSGQAIVKMAPYGQTLVLLFSSMLAVMYGSDPTSFDIRRYQGTTQRGAVAPNAVTVFANKIYFLSEDGLRSWDGADIVKESGLIDLALNPQATLTGAPLNATAYSLASLFSHADRLFLGMPFSSSDTDTAGLYILDMQAGGRWLRWKKATVSGGFSFGVTAGSTSTLGQSNLYITDGAGMIYQVAGGTYGDTIVWNGSLAAVTLSIATRWYTSPTRKVRAERAGYVTFAPVDNVSSYTPSYTLTVIPAGDTNQQHAMPFIASMGETAIGRQKVSSRVRGRYLQLLWTGSASDGQHPITLRNLDLIATEDRLL